MKIKLNPNRDELCEGRTTGIGFAFAEVTTNEIVGVDPISTCKDYLNDFVWSEKFEQDSRPIHGYSHKYCEFFKNRKRHTNVLISILNNRNNDWYEFDEHEKLLTKNYKNIESVLNSYENKISNNNYKSKIFKLDDNLYLLKLSKYWVQETALISLATLLCRIAYTGFTSLDDIKIRKNAINVVPSYSVNTLIDVLEKTPLLEEFKYTNDKTTIRAVHNNGCLSKYFKNYLNNNVKI